MAIVIIVPPSVEQTYPDAQFERQPHGTIFLDGREAAHTLQCPHCNTHFVSRKGSGHRRTFCQRCMAVTCGRHECDTCVPWEKQMEMIERKATQAMRGL